jgi:hypothetical protein
MTPNSAQAAHPGARSIGLQVYLATVGLLATFGAALAILTITTPSGHRHGTPTVVTSGPAAVGDAIPISFGYLAVLKAERLNGLTAKKLSGMTHGIQNLVRRDQAQVEVRVEMTNTLSRPVTYQPGRFDLRLGRSGRHVAPVGASVVPGQLQPDAHVEFVLTYVVPRNGKRLWLAYQDDEAGEELVDLGRVSRAPAGAAEPEHDHQN